MDAPPTAIGSEQLTPVKLSSRCEHTPALLLLLYAFKRCAQLRAAARAFLAFSCESINSRTDVRSALKSSNCFQELEATPSTHRHIRSCRTLFSPCRVVAAAVPPLLFKVSLFFMSIMPQRRAAARSDSKDEIVPFSQSLGPVEKHKLTTLDNPSMEDDLAPLSIEDRYETERTNAKLNHWKEHAFAVGAVGVSWEEECRTDRACCEQCCSEEVDANCCICCSGYFCKSAGRVGNMVVLKQSMEWVEHVEVDEETGSETVRKYQRPRLDCVVGPFWPMLMCVTYPLILGVSLWTALVAMPGKPFSIQAVWGTLTLALIYALAKTACTDPGILYRHAAPPPQDENSWRWSDQGQTYRPRGAYYDTDCAVVVEEFDHT